MLIYNKLFIISHVYIQNISYKYETSKIVNQLIARTCMHAKYVHVHVYTGIVKLKHPYMQLEGIPHPKNNSQQSHIIRSRLFKNKGSGDIFKLHV